MRHGRSSLFGALMGAFLLGSTACYAFLEPQDLASRAQVGADIRLTLTDSGTVVLRSLLGPTAEDVVGLLVSDSSQAYVLHVSGVAYRNGSEITWRGETVTIDKALVSSLGVRQFSPGRTAIMAGGTLAVLWGLRQVFVGVGQGSTTITGYPRTGGQ